MGYSPLQNRCESSAKGSKRSHRATYCEYCHKNTQKRVLGTVGLVDAITIRPFVSSIVFSKSISCLSKRNLRSRHAPENCSMTECGRRSDCGSHGWWPFRQRLPVFLKWRAETVDSNVLNNSSTRQAIYVLCKNEARSRIIVAVEKQKKNTYSCVCVCPHAREHVPGRVGVCMSVHACSLAYPACNAYAPYCDVICGPSSPTTFFDIIS